MSDDIVSRIAKAEATTKVLRLLLEDAVESWNQERRGNYEADRYKARGRVEGIADTWDRLHELGLAELREIKVYG